MPFELSSIVAAFSKKGFPEEATHIVVFKREEENFYRGGHADTREIEARDYGAVCCADDTSLVLADFEEACSSKGQITHVFDVAKFPGALSSESLGKIDIFLKLQQDSLALESAVA